MKILGKLMSVTFSAIPHGEIPAPRESLGSHLWRVAPDRREGHLPRMVDADWRDTQSMSVKAPLDGPNLKLGRTYLLTACIQRLLPPHQ